MEILIITSLLGDFSKIAEEIEKELKGKNLDPCAYKAQDEPVSIHAYDMLAQAYDAKFEECEKLKAENKKYSQAFIAMCDEWGKLKDENRKLTEQLSRHRYFIECQKNEIEKL